MLPPLCSHNFRPRHGVDALLSVRYTKVLLADEPASGLSAAQRTVLADALTAVSKDRAVVVVEHDLDMLTSVSEHIWAMVEGRLAYSGNVETFRSSPVYADLRGIDQA